MIGSFFVFLSLLLGFINELRPIHPCPDNQVDEKVESYSKRGSNPDSNKTHVKSDCTSVRYEQGTDRIGNPGDNCCNALLAGSSDSSRCDILGAVKESVDDYHGPYLTQLLSCF